ncbi:MAG: C-GCAxxG-C-C family protein [Christensenellaceae bacterium]
MKTKILEETVLEGRSAAAKRYFLKGYSCSQAVVLAFLDILDIERETAVRIAGPFGGGMGRLREVCGAFSGALIVLGEQMGYAAPEEHEQKKRLYRQVQKMAAIFEEKNGSIICRELLGLRKNEAGGMPDERTSAYYKTRPCADLCAFAASALEQILKEEA